MRDTTEQLAYDALREIAELWEALHAARVPGSRRRWSERVVSDEEMGLRDRAAQLEREERARFAQDTRSLPVQPGHSPAPLDVDALSTIALVTTDVLQWERVARRHFGHDPAGHAVPSSTRTVAAVSYSTPVGRLEPNQHGPRLPLALGHSEVLTDEDWSADPRVPAALAYLRANVNGIAESFPQLMSDMVRKARSHALAARQTLGLQPRRHQLAVPCRECGVLGLVALIDRDPPLIVHPKPLGCGWSVPQPLWHRNGLGLDLAVAKALGSESMASSRRLPVCRCAHTRVVHSGEGPCTGTTFTAGPHPEDDPVRSPCTCTAFRLDNTLVKPVRRRRSA